MTATSCPCRPLAEYTERRREIVGVEGVESFVEDEGAEPAAVSGVHLDQSE
jgi:hypothetical protein